MRWLLISLPFLVLCTACPETWGKGGIMDRAVELDTQNAMKKPQRPQDCAMSYER